MERISLTELAQRQRKVREKMQDEQAKVLENLLHFRIFLFGINCLTFRVLYYRNKRERRNEKIDSFCPLNSFDCDASEIR